MIEIVNLVLREGGIICSYVFLGICEAIFRGRDLHFCVEPHISIYFTGSKSFFNLDNLEPAPGRPELEVKALKTGHPRAGSRLSNLKNDFISVKYIII